MKSDRRDAPVAIVGGGFSGTMVAAQLARRGVASVVIAGAGQAGRGVAYSTAEPAHLLNVCAAMMSAWADAPDDFARWSVERGGDPEDYAQRRMFGVYLREILDENVASGAVQVIGASAVAATPSNAGWSVELDDGRSVECAAVVLANGNQAPEPLPFAAAAGPRMINNPWGPEAQAAVRDAAVLAAEGAGGGEVLLIGTGLTMVDLVLSLDAAGHLGRIVALSRRGLVPRGHEACEPASVSIDAVPQGKALALWRWLRRRSGEVGWRSAVDSLRPHSQALWQGLSPIEQRRFLRHARPWWDVHRHRIAPQISARLAALVDAGRLEIRAGRIGSMRDLGDGVGVEIRRRGGKGQSLGEEGQSLEGQSLEGQSLVRGERFAFVFNCTGPLGAVGRTSDQLLRGLLDAGDIRPDALGIGLAVDARSRVVGAPRLWALGPLTKGRYWEIVAVPDISHQAAAVAEDIARELQT